jgi:hypothetical protein
MSIIQNNVSILESLDNSRIELFENLNIKEPNNKQRITFKMKPK